ncbi:SGNH/GDSL hydrolase family protein [Amycolatopsis rhabdoformis]|uniref:SGNH/GDSL hydrolase family protein n=1 Tax=Amycolatopsis rhabdoformis TaxID=1448059 RepID=A0ABZ1I5K0_9PSEU|nr:SGNH/GDSL hydrolase family protein [Amycolatopsis rhabdoformis]WSE28744.1 SGNH/GDSL hydrolase family protein [Amycolatopsis rhabdoformis]
MALLRFFLFAVLAPVLAVQAVRVRRGTPRLPGAGGPAEGVVGDGVLGDAVTGGGVVGGGVAGGGVVVRLAVLGESTVDGVGVAAHADGLTGQLAGELARRGLRVRWQAVGLTGANASVVRRELVARLSPADVVVIALGVNDTLELHSAARFRRDLLGVVVDVRRRLGPVPVVLAGVPPMAAFPSLPRPLRDALSARSTALDRAAAELAKVPGVAYSAMTPDLLHEGTFAEDRFHPGPLGYRDWAAALAPAVVSAVSGLPGVTVGPHPREPRQPI